MDIEELREDFPALEEEEAYLDSACMTLKPRQVMEAMNHYYEDLGACGGKRSSHPLSRKTQEKAREARGKVAEFINAERDEVVWTRNTTESMNLVANALELEKGDNIVVTNLDHHSGSLPFWKMAQQKEVELRVLETRDGLFEPEAWQEKIDEDTALVSLVHVSNVTGTETPVKQVVEIAHENDARVVLDGAQSVPHQPVDVKELDVDFLAFSIHKMLGPTGMGVLYGKRW
ncbi:MAG: aminotransferase class V-fold PLP-dependent enzyme, partial [Candidatus Nanohaloarchaea archaeon]|nr:aminotransferase class V-fold PLP-dependent enzyme [Candidatus Nanohaloarchaea archaeon]